MDDLRKQIDMTQRTCSIEGCDRIHSGRGYCGPHYQRWHRYGDPLGAIDRSRGTCSFLGCDKPHVGRGYCGSHGSQLRQGKELQPLRSYGGGICSAHDCDRPLVAQGYCAKHWQRWRTHGDAERVDQSREGSRKYTLNEAFFDEITTETQAYWLGFITADGCIINSGRTNALRVDLSQRDADHLARMRDDLGSTRPISFQRTFACVSFDSWRMVESLGRLGITPRKSATVQPWNGPEHLMPHYWRGMVDGDGCISRIRRDGTWSITLVGSEACVRRFAGWASLICGSKATPRHVKGGCWSWCVAGVQKPQLLADALYRGAAVSLDRKQELANQLHAVDFAARRAAGELRRAVSIREAWDSGRHPRAKVR